MTARHDTYHHGDLRAALLTAGEKILEESGIANFSLRHVARQVGVSHSAPAHHFGDAQGLLAALATDGFRRFLSAMRLRQRGAGDDPKNLLLASGLGYLDFALAAPALFRLMFGDDRIKHPPLELLDAADAAFRHLASDIERLRGVSPFVDLEAMADVMAAWSLAHGFAELLIAGRMKPVQEMNRAAQEAFFRSVFGRLIA